MLNGFENITQSLTSKELETLLPGFIAGLKKRVGKNNAITSTAIIKGFEQKGTKINGSTVRKIINHIRTHDLLPGLIASEKGYYISNDTNEIKEYVKSLAGRENEIRRVKETFINHLKRLENRSQQNLYQ